MRSSLMYVKYNISTSELFLANKKAQMLVALGFVESGGDGGNRTLDLRIMNPAL